MSLGENKDEQIEYENGSIRITTILGPKKARLYWFEHDEWCHVADFLNKEKAIVYFNIEFSGTPV